MKDSTALMIASSLLRAWASTLPASITAKEIVREIYFLEKNLDSELRHEAKEFTHQYFKEGGK